MPNQIYQHDLWDRLQQPAHPANLPAGYLLLLAAIDQGWQITGPVIINPPEWYGETCDFAFTLLQNINDATMQRLTIPQCREVEAFIREEGLAVVGDCHIV